MDRHESQWDENGQSRAENWMIRLYHRVVSASAEAALPNGCQEGLKEFICHSTLPLCISEGVYCIGAFERLSVLGISYSSYITVAYREFVISILCLLWIP